MHMLIMEIRKIFSVMQGFGRCSVMFHVFLVLFDPNANLSNPVLIAGLR